MIYPRFLKDGDTIGVTAMSAGVGKYLDNYKKSIRNIEKFNYSICETRSVRVNSRVSNTGNERAIELDRLVKDSDISLIMCAAGGDFAIEMLPFINEVSIIANPKWYVGASDPTSFLFYITTKFDIATLYGFNAQSFDLDELHESQLNFFNIIRGNIVTQNSFPLYEKDKEKRKGLYNLTKKVYWDSITKYNNMSGRLIGGCIDVLRDLIGTRFDYTVNFINRYKDDGIIWYFDNFSLSCEDLYRCLFQMKECGWFNYCKGVIMGRILYPSNSYFDFNYKDVLLSIFGDIPIVMDADIGHVCPKMTMINGSFVNISYSNGKGKIDFELR